MADNAATIGALAVILGGDASALDKMLKGAQNSVSSFARNVTQIAGGIGLEKAIEGAVSAMTGMIEKGLADADALSRMAESTGVSIDQLSKLKYAGDLSNVSLDTLGKAMQNLSVGLEALASGSVTPATKALTAMGISATNTDGSVKNAGQGVLEVAAKFSTYKDGAGKAALAQGAFGAGGEALIPMLNKGSAGLAQMGDEAQKFGLVLDGPTQFAVDSLNQNLKKMDAIKQGLVLTIVSKMVPAFDQISAAMLTAKENSTLMSDIADTLTTILKGTISVCLQVAVVFRQLGSEISAFADAIKGGSWLNLGDTIAGAFAASDAAGAKFKDQLTAIQETFSKVGISGEAAMVDQTNAAKYAASEFAKAAAAAKQIAPPKIPGDTIDALQVFIDRTMKSAAAVDAQAQTVGKGTDALAALKVQQEASAIATSKHIEITDEYRDAINKAADASAAAAQKLAGAQLTQANLAPWEQRNQLLTQYNGLLAAGKISSDTFSAASQKLQFPNFTAARNTALDFTASLDTLASSGLNDVASAYAQVATGQKSFSDAFTAASLQFLTQLAEMIAKAVLFKIIMTAIGFAGGGPISGGTGFSLTGTGGLYASGGIIAGPGTGTSDSIPIMASNGEFIVNAAQTRKYAPLLSAINLDKLPAFAGGGMISSRVSGSQGNASLPSGIASAAPTPVTLQLQGAIFDKKTLAGLIDSLNGMFRNGYRLQVV